MLISATVGFSSCTGYRVLFGRVGVEFGRLSKCEREVESLRYNEVLTYCQIE